MKDKGENEMGVGGVKGEEGLNSSSCLASKLSVQRGRDILIRSQVQVFGVCGKREIKKKCTWDEEK